MKKISKLFLSVLLSLSIALTVITPAFAAVARAKKLKATVTYSAVTLSWQKAKNVSGYEIQQYVAKKKSWKKVGTTKKVRFTVKKLKTGTTYKFRVVSFKKSGKKVTYGKPSVAVSAKPVCAAPKKLKAAVLSPTSAKLTWKKVNGATHYTVQKFNGKKWVKVASTKANALTVSNLTANVATKFRVRAVTKVGKKNILGKLSNAITVKTSIPTTIVAFKAASSNSVSLSWGKVAGASEYIVYRIDGTKYVQVASSKTTEATVGNLSANTVYRFAVRAKVGTALSGYSAAVNTKTAPAAVSNLSASAEKSGSVTLRWTDAPGNEKTEIYTVKDGKNTLVATAQKGVTEYTVTGLSELTEYTFKVKTVGVYGGKTLSGTFSGEVKATTLVSGVNDFKFVSSTESSITVSWLPSGGATAFVLEKSTDKKTWTKVDDVTASGTSRVSYTVSGLSNASLYLRISTDVNGTKISSTEVFAKTLPSAVTNLKATLSADSKSTVLSWTAVPGANGYIVKNTATGKTFESKTNSYTVTGLSENAEYSFSVAAFVTLDGTKLNGKSAAVSFKTAKISSIENLRSSSRYDIQNNTFVVSGTLLWTPIYNVEFVVEKMNPATDKTWVSLGKTTSNSIVVSSDIKAKQTKKSDYVTTISWDSVPGAKEYLVQTSVVSNSRKFDDAIKTTATSIDLRLAPSTEYTVIVQAVASSVKYRVKAVDPNKALLDSAYSEITVSGTDAVIGSSSVKFTTAAAPAFTSSSTESQELYTLRLIQAINNSKYETTPVKVHSVSKFDAEIKNIKLKYGILPATTFSNIKDLLKKLDMSEDDLIGDLGENHNLTINFENGFGSYQYKYTDSNGKEQVGNSTAYLSSFVSPAAHPAYLYDQHNLSSFSKGISAVSVAKSGNSDTITVSLKKEDQTESSNALYHPGFLDSITESLSDLSEEDATVTATVGASTISGTVNANGTLDSLTVSSPFTINISMTVSGKMTISFVVSGTVNNSYTFTR